MWCGEICKRCRRRNVIGFQVPDEVWEKIVRGRWDVLCTTCFDEEAELAVVSYTFLELYPVPWDSWEDPEDSVPDTH